MVAPTPINLASIHGHTFKGFVQFQIPNGSLWYRLKERQSMSFAMNFNRANHYSDDGTLVIDPAGQNHTFQMTIKITSDMFDTVFSASSDKKTLSYWIYQNTILSPIDIIFVTSFENLAGSSPYDTSRFVNLKFVLDPSSFTSSLGASGGSPEMIVSGAVKSITSATRSTTSDQ